MANLVEVSIFLALGSYLGPHDVTITSSESFILYSQGSDDFSERPYSVVSNDGSMSFLPLFVI